MGKRDLEYYKTNVNLIEFARWYDYKVVVRKSTSLIKQMVNDQEDLIKVWCNKNKQWRYINLHNDSDKGTIIDFIQNRKSMNLGQVRGEIYRFIDGNSDVFNKPIMSKTQLEFDPLLLDKLEFSDLSYLLSRGLSKEILNHEKFTGRIFNQRILVNGSERYVNTVFPIFNKEGFCGLDIRNKEYKGSLKGSDKYSGIWISQFDKSRKIDRLYVMESAIDCISHYELLKTKDPECDDNICYIASGGNLNYGQIETLNFFIDRASQRNYKVQKLILAFDNDNAGMRFTTMLMGRILVVDSMVQKEYAKQYPGITHLMFDVVKDPQDVKLIIVGFIDNLKEKKLLQSTIESFLKPDETLIKVDYDNSKEKQDDSYVNIVLTFQDQSSDWQMIIQFIHQLRFDLSSNVDFELPFYKDFNEDLIYFKRYRK